MPARLAQLANSRINRPRIGSLASAVPSAPFHERASMANARSSKPATSSGCGARISAETVPNSSARRKARRKSERRTRAELGRRIEPARIERNERAAWPRTHDDGAASLGEAVEEFDRGRVGRQPVQKDRPADANRLTHDRRQRLGISRGEIGRLVQPSHAEHFQPSPVPTSALGQGSDRANRAFSGGDDEPRPLLARRLSEAASAQP